MIVAKLAAAILLVSSPFTMTMGPVKLAAQPGGTPSVYVFNTGKKLPDRVVMQFREIERNAKGICYINPRPVTWASASPRAFIVPPRHYQEVRVRIADSGPKPGNHDLAIEAVALVSRTGNIRLNVTFLTQTQVIFPGPVPKHRPKPCISLAPPKGAGGFPWLWTVASACALVLMLLAGLIIYRHRRRPRGLRASGKVA